MPAFGNYTLIACQYNSDSTDIILTYEDELSVLLITSHKVVTYCYDTHFEPYQCMTNLLIDSGSQSVYNESIMKCEQCNIYPLTIHLYLYIIMFLLFLLACLNVIVLLLCHPMQSNNSALFCVIMPLCIRIYNIFASYI